MPSVLNILHDEGRALNEEMLRRVEAVIEREASARLLLPSIAMSEKEKRITERFIENRKVVEKVLPPSTDNVESEYVARSETVILQVDEVMVAAQPSTGQEDLVLFSAVITSAESTVYLSGENLTILSRQVAAYLTILGVAQGKRPLLMMGDGAKWIQGWYEGMRIEEKSLITCWHHLVKRCREFLGGIGFEPGLRRSTQKY